MPEPKKFSKLLARFRRNVEGGVAIIFGISAVSLLLIGGVALDFERLNRTAASLQDSLDAALLAAATSDDISTDHINTIIANYLDVNWQSKHPDVKLTYNFTVGADGTITGTARGDLKTTMMALAGKSTMGFSVTSQVMRGGTALELALVLDTTGSMKQNNKMVELKKAATDLVKSLIKRGGDDVRIAIVPYANYVNVGTTHKGASWLGTSAISSGKSSWNGCVGSRNYPLDMTDAYGSTQIPAIADVTCSNDVVRLSSKQGPLVSTIESMKPSGKTYIPAGLTWGWRMISDQLPFADGTSAGEKYNDKPVRKVVVLMTDGDNTLSPTYPAHEDDGHDTSLADSLAEYRVHQHEERRHHRLYRGLRNHRRDRQERAGELCHRFQQVLRRPELQRNGGFVYQHRQGPGAVAPRQVAARSAAIGCRHPIAG